MDWSATGFGVGFAIMMVKELGESLESKRSYAGFLVYGHFGYVAGA